MKLFLDTANIDEIREINRWGVLGGVTTNPSLVAKEASDPDQVWKEILEEVDGPISLETTELEADAMYEQGVGLSQMAPNAVVKVPMTPDGLAAGKRLVGDGIRINVTLVFSPAQLATFPRDEEEEVDISITIGPKAKKPLTLDIPIMAGGMGYGIGVSEKVKIAIAQGTAAVGTCTNTGEGPLLPEERENAKYVIVQYSSGHWSHDLEVLKQADAVEILGECAFALELHAVDGTREPRALHAVGRIFERLHLERQRDVAAAAAGGAKCVDRGAEAVERRFDQLVRHVLAGLRRERRMDLRRLRVAERIAEQCVAIGHRHPQAAADTAARKPSR